MRPMRIRGDSPFERQVGTVPVQPGSRAEQGTSTGRRTELVSGLEKYDAENADKNLLRRIQRVGLPEPVAVHLVLTPGWSDFRDAENGANLTTSARNALGGANTTLSRRSSRNREPGDPNSTAPGLVPRLPYVTSGAGEARRAPAAVRRPMLAGTTVAI